MRGSEYQRCGLIDTDWTVGTRTGVEEMSSHLMHPSWCSISKRVRLMVFPHLGIRVGSSGQKSTYYIGMVVPDGLIESGATPVGLTQVGVNA
ncbi:hypothetical protein GCM10010358_79600 [Streptomyces minutiscleroticus]|uniref:Uncharacterized protein n=1 Tax=Streptomyces minutiscleroticus TaxID=68238 RepID=A0A918UA24_9ACTN|nr:hypothetical protein GCM10010358_79600 [Streptomyces minutiscleroticus]